MSHPQTQPGKPELTWAIAELFPPQGEWSEEEYLHLPYNRVIEFCEGRLEIRPMPDVLHQRIVIWIFETLKAFIKARGSRGGGEVFVAALPMRVKKKRYREPDVMLVLNKHRKKVETHCLGFADLVIEVVSKHDPKHDWVTKKKEYAEAGIPEYWIIDPQKEQITVFVLEGNKYRAHDFLVGQMATSVLLSGFAVDVSSALNPE